MGTATLRRNHPAARTRPNGHSSRGLFYDRSLDRELAELERRGLARTDPGGTFAVTAQGLEALVGWHFRRAGAPMRRWLILCSTRNCWWSPRAGGYTDKVDEAGWYDDVTALDICERMNDGGNRPVKLIPIYVEDEQLERRRTAALAGEAR